MRRLKWLETVTAAILIAVLLAVAGMMGAVVNPTLATWTYEENAVVAMLAVLVTALVLVSVVALAQATSPHSIGEMGHSTSAVDKPEVKC